MAMHVGFVGLGLMGFPMAKNILKHGFPLSVYNRTPDKTKKLKGATTVYSPAELGHFCDVVITMVTGPSDVEEVCDKIATNPKKDLIIIDMSTIGPTAAKAIAQKLNDRGVEFIDAPVTGSTPKAMSGELTIFIGGKKEIVEKVKPVLLAMGKTLHFVGPVGSGQAIKLVNNYLIAGSVAMLAEAMFFGEAMGLTRQKMSDILKTVPAQSPMMNLKLSNYITRTYPLMFSMKNMKKDMFLASDEATKKKNDLPLLEAINGLYKKAIDKGLAEKDFSEIIKLFEEKETV